MAAYNQNSNIVVTHASSLSGTTVEILSYELAHSTGASIVLLDDIEAKKWILQLVAKSGKIISTAEFNYSEVTSKSIDRLELDYPNKKIILFCTDGTPFACDISEMIDDIFENINAVSENLSAEIIRAKAKEQEIVDKIESLDLEGSEVPGEYIYSVSQDDGQVSIVKRKFDNAITATAGTGTAPTSLAVKTYTDAETSRAKKIETALNNLIKTEKARAIDAEAKLQTALTDEVSARKAADKTLQDNIDAEAVIRNNKDIELGNKIATEEQTRKDADLILVKAIQDEATAREEADSTLQEAIITEETRAKAAEEILTQNLNTEILTRENGDILKTYRDKIGGQTFNLPYYFTNELTEDSANVTAYSISLDGKGNTRTDSIIVPSATNIKAGLMSKNDKITLDNLASNIPDEGAIRLLDNEEGSGQPYHFPYNITPIFKPTEAKIITNTITLDNNKTLTSYIFDIPMADENSGLMKASDAKAVRLDLPERISNLEARGRFLSSWNAVTGKPETEPTVERYYELKAGDYFIVGVIATEEGQTNKQPKVVIIDNKYYYDKLEASDVVETRELGIGDYYSFDGTKYILIQNTQKTTFFAQITGEPTDNLNLKNYVETAVNTEKTRAEGKESELATAISDVNTNLSTETTARKNGAILENYQSKIGGQTFNLPYYFSVDYTTDKATVNAHSISLDGTGTTNIYSLDIPAAIAETENASGSAGLLTANDAKELRSTIPNNIEEIKEKINTINLAYDIIDA